MFGFRKKNTPEGSHNGKSDLGFNDEQANEMLKTIIDTYHLSTVPYDDYEFRAWGDALLIRIEKELPSMNIDLDCFDIYINEIRSQVLKTITSANNQFYDHNSSIRAMIMKIKGKIKRFTDQKLIREADLKKKDEELGKLYEKKKAYEGE